MLSHNPEHTQSQQNGKIINGDVEAVEEETQKFKKTYSEHRDTNNQNDQEQQKDVVVNNIGKDNEPNKATEQQKSKINIQQNCQNKQEEKKNEETQNKNQVNEQQCQRSERFQHLDNQFLSYSVKVKQQNKTQQVDKLYNIGGQQNIRISVQYAEKTENKQQKKQQVQIVEAKDEEKNNLNQLINLQNKQSIQIHQVQKPVFCQISLTEQNQSTILQNNNNKQIGKIIQFQQYKPELFQLQKEKQSNNIQNKNQQSGHQENDNQQQIQIKVDQKNQDKNDYQQREEQSQQKQDESSNKNLQRQSSIQLSSKKQQLQPQPQQNSQTYKNIQNEALLKRIQQLQNTVKLLKKQKNVNNQSESQKNDFLQVGQIEKQKPQKVVIHDQSVYGLVTELAKNQQSSPVKKPTLHEKRYRKKRLDLSALMDKNMTHASNIFNVTVGQIIEPNLAHEQEKETLRKQIRQLRQKVLRLEQDKRTYSLQKADDRKQYSSTGKKPVFGRLVKVSELRASRISINQDQSRVKNQNAADTISQKDSFMDGYSMNPRKIRASATQRQNLQVQNQSSNSFGFRVRRPSNRSSINASSIQQKSSQLIKIPKDQRYEQNSSIQLTQNKNNEKKDKQWWQQTFISQIKMPELPSPPSQFDSQQDLHTLGKLTFLQFGVEIDSPRNLTVKKYKNCVYFSTNNNSCNILWYFDGRFYWGEWQVLVTGQGEKSGAGFEYVPGKYIYQGEFKQGKRHGFGKMQLLTKHLIYEGMWVDGIKCGQGKQIDEYNIKYQGEWKDNKRQGFGKLKLEDGDFYEGNFERGIKTGFGKQYFKNGDVYQGNYLANKFNEKGKYYWKNGSTYDGEFQHGMRSGKGKWRSSEKSEIQDFDEYEGEYENDKKNGYGKYRWADGSEYEGQFKDDVKEGQGTIRYKNGKVAKLLWKNGQPLKKIFSEEQKKYRETNKSSRKIQAHEQMVSYPSASMQQSRDSIKF